MCMPLVSVIIPTHNRANYAIPTIRSVLAASADIEVVVSDTSEIDLISAVFSNSPDLSRLRLRRPNRPMSVVDNFNEAMMAATGEYLVFIGDDDFVAREIVDVAKWAAIQKVDSIKFTFPVAYYWPDFKHRSRGDEYSGTLHISPFTGSVSSFDAKKALSEALHDFGGGVLDMPRAYAGMISRKLADKICDKYGKLFGGVSPDIYSAALISIESTRCVKIDYPVIVPGSSGASTAGLSANGKHVGELRDNPHIAAFIDLKWDERIPEFYSVPTVWSFSLLKSIEVAQFDIGKVNFSRLYAKCFLYQRGRLHFTVKSLVEYARCCGWLIAATGVLRSFVSEFIWVMGKLFDRFQEKYKSKMKNKTNSVNDTFFASVALCKYTLEHEKAINFDECVFFQK